MRLLHVSEERIERFVPRPSPPRSSRPGEPLVWAIDEDHLPRQLLPRDCPRVFAHRLPSTTATDAALLDGVDAAMWVEPAWLAAARSTTLFVHVLPAASFVLEEPSAGYWVSDEAVDPTSVEAVDDPVAALARRDVPVRTDADLPALAAAVAASTLGFSIVRIHLAGTGPPTLRGDR